jgi:predicted glycoside hydrolase/deacetylase ChbG (UPF0249 family)
MFAGRDIGVHLTMTCEYPGYRWRSLTGAASLHDHDGFMPATVEAFHAKADPADVLAEGRAQIEQAMAWGVEPTHLDSHMGTVQLDERFFAVYLQLADDYDLPIRMAGRREDERLGFGGRERAAAKGLLYPENFISPWPRDTRVIFQDRIPGLAAGVSEIYAHPVEDGPELRGYDPDHPEIRANDARVLADGAIRALLDASGVTPISFRPLRELQRRERAAR